LYLVPYASLLVRTANSSTRPLTGRSVLSPSVHPVRPSTLSVPIESLRSDPIYESDGIARKRFGSMDRTWFWTVSRPGRFLSRHNSTLTVLGPHTFWRRAAGN
jgi:hypothetical protein